MPERDRKTVTLVLACAHSGESRRAQEYVGTAVSIAFIPMAEPWDEEMRVEHCCHCEARPLYLSQLVAFNPDGGARQRFSSVRRVRSS
jgi:hypothetical protein